MAVKIQIRRDSAVNWTESNTVLSEGEIGLELDTGKQKIGDGTSAWSTLSYDKSSSESDLYFGLTSKLATTDTGATLTGTLTADGLTLGDDDVLTLGDANEFTLKHHNSGYTHLTNTAGTLYIDSDSVTFRDDDGSPNNVIISQSGIDVTGSVTAVGGSSLSKFERSHSTTTTPLAVLDIKAKSTGDMADGFGAAARFIIEDTAGVENVVAEINAVRSGADNLADIQFETQDTPRMTITSTGNVGIGTASPSRTLHINSGTANANTLFESTDVAVTARFKDTTGETELECRNDWRFSNNAGNNELMRIDSSGNVGIGESNPATPLHIKRPSDGTILRLARGGICDWDLSIGNTPVLSDGVSGDLELLPQNGNMGFAIGKSGSTDTLFRVKSTGDVEMGGDLDVSGVLDLSGINKIHQLSGHNFLQGDADMTYLYGGSGGGQIRNTDNSVSLVQWLDNGNVGIGTSTPAYNLVISNGGASGMEFGTTTSAQNLIQHYNRSALTYNSIKHIASSHRFNISGSGTDALTIDNAGVNLMGGTTGVPSPTVAGAAFHPGNNSELICSSGTSTGNNTQVRFYNGNGEVGSIKTNGSATSYNTSSDYRLKENVVPMSGSIDRLKLVKASRFNFIADPDNTVDGFLAHEIAEVVPEVTSGEKDAMKTEEYEVTPAVMDGDTIVTEAVIGEREVPDYQGIDQAKLVPLLTGALQEAIAKIEDLEARLTALETV